MKVLVTGGSGFIGSHVVDKLRDKGVSVRIFDGIMPTFRKDKDVEFYKGSILNFEDLSFAMHDIDIVFHLAAVADVKAVYERPHYAENINVRGTINVLEAARRNRVMRVIYGSTVWVYSDTQCNASVLDEEMPLAHPSHLYTATKLTSEYYCKAYAHLYGLEYTILRYGIPYGPRARDGAVIPIFVRKALNGEPLTIAGDGLQYRKFVYVEDLAEGNVLALKNIARNKIYNLEGKEKVTIRQIAETIQKLIEKVEIKYIEGRPGDFSGKEISSQKAKRELGWEAKTNFERGVRRYIEWYRKQKEIRKLDWEELDITLKKIGRD